MTFKIYGRIIDKKTGKGVPNLIVKPTSKELKPDMINTATTDRNGDYEIIFTNLKTVQDFLTTKPEIRLQIMTSVGKVIYTTEDTVQYTADGTKQFDAPLVF